MTDSASEALTTDKPFLSGFQASMASLGIIVSNLAVNRSWAGDPLFVSKASVDTPSDDRRISEVVAGTGRIKKDKLIVISESADAATQVRFSVRGASEEELRATWESGDAARELRFRELEAGDASADSLQLARLLRHCYAEFDKRPPSCSVLFWPQDRDIGVRDTWFVEASVSHHVYEAIASDVLSGATRKLRVYLMLNPMLTDAWWAPVSEPVTIGISRGRGRDGQSFGWLESVSWTCAAEPDRQMRRTGPPARDPQRT